MWAVPAKALAPATLSEYTFTGVCADFTGDGIGTLTLENYVLGQPLADGNFVSFSYHSNLISFSITAADLGFIQGIISGPFPSTETVTIDGDQVGSFLESNTSGFWCAGVSCEGDLGSTHSWNGAAAPEPSTWAMMLLGFAGLGIRSLSVVSEARGERSLSLKPARNRASTRRRRPPHDHEACAVVRACVMT
jgi:hypothetical protein